MFKKCGEFLDSVRTCQLVKKDSAPWSLFVRLFTDFCVEAKLSMLERLISVPITYRKLQNTTIEQKHHIHTYTCTYTFTDPSSTQVGLNVEFITKTAKLQNAIQSKKQVTKLHKIGKNMINYKEKIINTIVQSNYITHSLAVALETLVGFWPHQPASSILFCCSLN